MNTTITKEILFIDADVVDKQTLIAGVAPNIKIVELNNKFNVLDQMVAALKGVKNLDAIHIISHGSEAELDFSSGSLNSSNLANYSKQLKKIGQSLSKDGDILLYGCDIAKGNDGQAFINKLAKLTKADVAASDDLTGASWLGGDWNLEDTSSAISTNTIQATDYNWLLLLPSNGTYAIDTTFTSATGTYITGHSAINNTHWSSSWSEISYDGGPIGNQASGGISKVGGGGGVFIDTTPGYTQNTDGNTHWFKITSDNVNVASFQLTDIKLQNYLAGENYSVTVIGNKFGGGTISSSPFSIASTSITSFSSQLGSFSGIQLTSFELDFVRNGTSDSIADFTFVSFGLSNAIAPSSDTTPPTFDVAPATGSITASGFTPSASIDESGTIYYVVVPNNAAAPSVANVKAGVASGGTTALVSGNYNANSGSFDSSFSAVTGLTAGTDYDVYFVATDAAGNDQASVTLIDVVTNATRYLYYFTSDGSNSTTGATDALHRINIDGTGDTIISSSVANGLGDLAVDIANGKAYFVNTTTGGSQGIYSIDLSTGTVSLFTSTTNNPGYAGLVLDSVNGYLYYLTSDGSNSTTGATDALHRINIDGTGDTVISSSVANGLGDLAVDIANGKAYFVNTTTDGSQGIYSIDLSTGTVSLFTSTTNNPGYAGLVLDSVNGYLYYFTSDGSNSTTGATDALHRINIDGTGDTVISSSVANGLGDLAVDIANGKAYFVNTTTGGSQGIYSIDLSTGTVSSLTVTTNNPGYSGIVINDGTIPTFNAANSSPADNATGVDATSNLALRFSESVVKGVTGNFVIRDVTTNTTLETISYNDARVTGWGTNTLTINPNSTLTGTHNISVQWSYGAIQDYYSNFVVANNTDTTYNFAVSTTNAAPVISDLNGDSSTFVLGGAPVWIDVADGSSFIGAQVTDSDNTNFNSGSLTIVYSASANATLNNGSLSLDTITDPTNAVLAGTTLGNADGVIVAGETIYYDSTAFGTVGDASHDGQNGHPLVITFNSSATPTTGLNVSNVGYLLEWLTYTAATLTGDRVFDVTISDGSGGTSATSTVTMTGTNTAPTLATPTTASYTDTSASNTFSNTTGTLVGSDADITAGAVQTLSYGISTGTTGGSTIISAVTYDVSKTGTYGTLYVKSANGAYVFVPSASAINARTTNITETFTTTVSDGTATANATLTIDITAANDTPILTTPTTASYTDTAANDTFTNTTGILSASDAEGTALTYAVSNGTGTYGNLSVVAGTGAYTYTPNNSAINALSANTSETFTVTASDGSLSDSKTFTVNLTGVNDTPVNTVPAAQTTAEDTALVLSSNALSVADVDTGSTITTVISVVSGTGTLAVTTGGGATITNDGTASVQIVGTVTQVQTALASVTYTPTADANGTSYATLTISSTDGGSLNDTDTVTIDVTPVADTPSITGASTTPSTQTTSGLVLSRNVVDSTEVTHFKITNITNGSLYQNDGTTAIAANTFITYAQASAGLKFTPSGSTNGTFDLQASTSNAAGGLGGDVITATISVGIGVASPTINEDTDSGAIAITGDKAYYKITSITGGTLYSDAAYTTAINNNDFLATAGGTTNVYFRPILNFNGAAGFSVQGASSANAGGLTGSAVSSTITVTAVNDVPTISNLDTDNLAYLMGSGVKLIDQGTATAVADVDSVNFNSGSLTVSISANRVTTEDELAIENQGTAAGQIGISGSNVSYGGTNIGTFTGGSGSNDLVVTFNASATPTAVAALIQHITYQNTNTTNCSVLPRTVSFVVNDGGGSSVSSDVTITVSQNTPPTATNGTVTTNEDTAYTFSSTDFHFSDVDNGDTLQQVKITVLPLAGTLTLNGTAVTANQIVAVADITTGKLKFLPAANANGTGYASFSFQVSDNKNYSDASYSETINVISVNDAPTLSTSNSISYTDTTGNDSFNNATGNLIGSDIDSASLSYGVVNSTGSYGTLNVSSTGAYTYTPNASAINALTANATDTFTVTISDSNGGSSNATLSVSLIGVNDSPALAAPTSISYNDTEKTDSFDAISGTLSGSDADSGQSLVYSVSNNGKGNYGSLTISNTGTYTYTPDNSAINKLTANATDTFTINASDGNGGNADNIFNINLTGVNDLPVITSIAPTITYTDTDQADIFMPITYEAKATDVDSSTLTWSVKNGANAYGTLKVESGIFTYTPDATKIEALKTDATENFVLQVSDGSKVATQDLSIKIVAVDDTTTFKGQFTGELSEDGILNAAGKIEVLDREAGDALIIAQSKTAGAYGRFSIDETGAWTYELDNGKVQSLADETVTDEFAVKTTGGTTQNVTLSISGVNDAPVGETETYSTLEDKELKIVTSEGVLANDSDVDSKSLSAILKDAPAHGKFSLAADGSFSYQPDAKFSGIDTFSYKVGDGKLESEPVTVTINVTPVNHLPKAITEQYEIFEDNVLNISANSGVLSNDSDEDANSQLTAILVAKPTHGSFTLEANGAFIYEPEKNYNGSDSFSYKTSDGQLESEPVTVSLTVTSVNDKPLIVSQNIALQISENTSLDTVIDAVQATDDDTDQQLTYSLSGADASHFNINEITGAITLKQAANFEVQNQYSFEVIASDNAPNPLSNKQIVTLNITNINEEPVAVSEQYTLSEDQKLTVATTEGVLANDKDEDADSKLSTLLVEKPAHGTLTLEANGAFVYEPDANYNGNDSFTYKADDGSLSSQPVTVSLSVNPVNDAPSFKIGANQKVQAGAEAQTLPAWATDINAGENESNQHIIFKISSDNNTLFDSQPAIDSNGNLTYKPAPKVSGVATVSVFAKDDGGVANNGVDTSEIETFTITVEKPKDTNTAPVITSNGGAEIGVLSVAEKQTKVTTVSAIDKENNAIRYSLGGADKDFFIIDTKTGDLQFITKPLVKNPLSSTQSNDYQIEVTAQDDGVGNLFDMQKLTVTVLSDIDADGKADKFDDDIDGDGILNPAENSIPNPNGQGQGDANADGISDELQPNVGAIKTISNDKSGSPRYAALTVDEGLTIQNITNATAKGLPKGTTLPLGAFGFTVGNVPVGGAVTITLTVSPDVVMNSYLKQDNTGKWKTISPAAIMGGDATKKTISFSITDGGIFDKDGVADGKIVDPGGPAVTANAPVIAQLANTTITLNETNDILSTSGVLTSTNSANFTMVEKTIKGLFGSLTVDKTGNWTYMTDSAHNEFLSDKTYPDAFEVQTTDGWKTSIVLNLKGTKDTPLIIDDAAQQVLAQAEIANVTQNILNGHLILQSEKGEALVQNADKSWTDLDKLSVKFTLLGTGKVVEGIYEKVTLPNGSSLKLNTFDGSYTYTPNTSINVLDTTDKFMVSANGGSLELNFNRLDLLDRDGIPDDIETQLADLANTSQEAVSGDLNNDGVEDKLQGAVANVAWITNNDFKSALTNHLKSAKPIINVVVTDTDNKADDSAQLSQISVLAPNSKDIGGKKPESDAIQTPWDPLQFSIAATSNTGLKDVDENRDGVQTKIKIDISRAGESDFNAYMKYVSAKAIKAYQKAGTPLVTLDGEVLTETKQAGWYDFTQRTENGDGAKFIHDDTDGHITDIEIIITDNKFGDDNPATNKIDDPSLPVIRETPIVVEPKPVEKTLESSVNVSVLPDEYSNLTLMETLIDKTTTTTQLVDNPLACLPEWTLALLNIPLKISQEFTSTEKVIAPLNGFGNASANKIIGNSANNILNGLVGADTLTGGLGADTFVFSDGDVIDDFNALQGDKIDVREMNVTAFVKSFTKQNGQMQFDSENHLLQIDTNGDANADISITVLGVTSLSVDMLITK